MKPKVICLTDDSCSDFFFFKSQRCGLDAKYWTLRVLVDDGDKSHIFWSRSSHYIGLGRIACFSVLGEGKEL